MTSSSTTQPRLGILLLIPILALKAAAALPASTDWWSHPAAEMRPVVPVVVPPPQPHFDPRTYGAKGDGVTYDTEALQKAIDACGGTGGSVILKSGKFLSANLTLHGKMTLYVEKGSVLLGGTRAEDYPVVLPDNAREKALCRSLLYACKADGLVIDGDGEIDGQCRLVQMSGKEPDRPSLIRVFRSRDVTVRNITLRNPRMWTQIYIECEHLLIDNVKVSAPPDCPNLDGMDICDSHDVIIRNCNVQSEDDSICLKSMSSAGLKNITIENNRIRSFRANAIKLGTGTAGPVSHLLIQNNTVTYAKFGGLCIESVDGSAVSDVVVRGLDLYRCSQPVFVRLAIRGGNPADRTVRSINGVTIERVRALGTHNATRASCSITGIPGLQVRNVSLKDCYFEMPGGISKAPAMPSEKTGYPQSNIFGDTPAYGFFIRHASGISMDNVVIGRAAPDVRPWLVETDADVRTTACRDLGQIQPQQIPKE